MEDENKQEQKSIVDEAREEREKMQKVLDELKTVKAEIEESRARAAMGGSTDAGEKDEKPKPESDHDYRVRIEKEIAEGKFNAPAVEGKD